MNIPLNDISSEPRTRSESQRLMAESVDIEKQSENSRPSFAKICAVTVSCAAILTGVGGLGYALLRIFSSSANNSRFQLLNSTSTPEHNQSPPTSATIATALNNYTSVDFTSAPTYNATKTDIIQGEAWLSAASTPGSTLSKTTVDSTTPTKVKLPNTTALTATTTQLPNTRSTTSLSEMAVSTPATTQLPNATSTATLPNSTASTTANSTLSVLKFTTSSTNKSTATLLSNPSITTTSPRASTAIEFSKDVKQQIQQMEQQSSKVAKSLLFEPCLANYQGPHSHNLIALLEQGKAETAASNCLVVRKITENGHKKCAIKNTCTLALHYPAIATNSNINNEKHTIAEDDSAIGDIGRANTHIAEFIQPKVQSDHVEIGAQQTINCTAIGGVHKLEEFRQSVRFSKNALNDFNLHPMATTTQSVSSDNATKACENKINALLDNATKAKITAGKALLKNIHSSKIAKNNDLAVQKLIELGKTHTHPKECLNIDKTYKNGKSTCTLTNRCSVSIGVVAGAQENEMIDHDGIETSGDSNSLITVNAGNSLPCPVAASKLDDVINTAAYVEPKEATVNPN